MQKDILSLIKTKSFCILPWTHLYYFNDGYVYPCSSLANKPEMRLGTINQAPEEIWNSKTLRDLRLKMLSNEEIPLCNQECNDCLNSCKKYFGNSLISSASASIESTNLEGYSDYNFIAWNIFESNACNLECTYCDSFHSSSWAKKEKKSINNLNSKNTNIIYSDLSSVEEIWFSGGESMLMKSTINKLRELLTLKRNHVRVRIITNLSTNTFSEEFFATVKQFKNLIIFGSWDLDGERGEYIRKNINNNLIRKNINLINANGIRFYLQSVMSILNIYYYFDFHRQLYEEGLVKKDNVRYYNLHFPEYLRYSILSKNKKNIIKNKLLDYKKWLASGDELNDFYPNRESPLYTIDKLIECMYTGTHGHHNFSVLNNNKFFNVFLKNLIESNKVKLFSELL